MAARREGKRGHPMLANFPDHAETLANFPDHAETLRGPRRNPCRRKWKKLEPLEDYVPAIILTQLQFQNLEKSLEEEELQYAICRSLLRSGPASSFRANVRAVAEYASDGGMGKVAFDKVDQCLRALEELDLLLLQASRNDPSASVKLMKGQIAVALTALDSLLQTVPSPALEKGKAMANAYRAPLADDKPIQPDLQLKQLESIL